MQEAPAALTVGQQLIFLQMHQQQHGDEADLLCTDLMLGSDAREWLHASFCSVRHVHEVNHEFWSWLVCGTNPCALLFARQSCSCTVMRRGRAASDVIQ